MCNFVHGLDDFMQAELNFIFEQRQSSLDNFPPGLISLLIQHWLKHHEENLRIMSTVLSNTLLMNNKNTPGKDRRS